MIDAELDRRRQQRDQAREQFAADGPRAGRARLALLAGEAEDTPGWADTLEDDDDDAPDWTTRGDSAQPAERAAARRDWAATHAEALDDLEAEQAESLDSAQRGERRASRRPLMGKGGTRRRGDNGVPPRHRLLGRLRATPPAALEWRDAQVPLLGRLWANFWLPSVLLAGCLVAMVYLLQTSGVATTGYDIQSLQMQRDDWQLRNEQLQFELSKRRSLTWIESEATGRLGMVRPEPTALTYVKVSR